MLNFSPKIRLGMLKKMQYWKRQAVEGNFSSNLEKNGRWSEKGCKTLVYDM